MVNPTDLSVSLIDYGLCDFITEENQGKFHRRCGSEEYCAAEMISNYKEFDGVKVDVWCLGVVLYALMSATFPFDSKKRRALLQAGCSHPIVNVYFDCSPEAKDLITKMLDTNPGDRLNMEEVAKHPWMML
jgi:serine/threonine protein kinase